jgi:hypothetical protein
MTETLYIIFGIPMIAGNAWLLVGKADQIKWRWAATIILYDAIYIAIFHFWLRHI